MHRAARGMASSSTFVVMDDRGALTEGRYGCSPQSRAVGGDSVTDAVTGRYLPFARPSITDREKQAVLEILDSGWLTTGPRTKLFEERFAAFVGVRHALALNSATAAL